MGIPFPCEQVRVAWRLTLWGYYEIPVTVKMLMPPQQNLGGLHFCLAVVHLDAVIQVQNDALIGGVAEFIIVCAQFFQLFFVLLTDPNRRNNCSSSSVNKPH